MQTMAAITAPLELYLMLDILLAGNSSVIELPVLGREGQLLS